MRQPRYAVPRLNLSLTRSITAVAVAATAALVCAPLLPNGDGAASAATDARPAAVSAPAGVAADSTTSPAAGFAAVAPVPVKWPGAIAIHPSKVVAVAPAAAPVQAVFGPAGQVGALGIPVLVLQAYHAAADKLAVEEPSCKLPWWLLAGIGHTESGHAESGRLYADGTTRGKILGPRLNGGIAGDAVISDTDHGAYDGDTVYDRAVGPMQFIPSTWVRWGADGNGDGKKDPSNIFDASLAAGRYLCADGRDLSTMAGLTAAILSYNHSAPYLATVLAWGAAYRDGASAVNDSVLPVITDVTKARPPVSARPKAKPKPAAKPATSATPSRPAPMSTAPVSASPSSSPTRPSATPTSCAPTTRATPSPSGSTSSRSVAQSVSQSAAPQSATAQSVAAQPQATSARTSTSPSGTSTGSASATPTSSPSGCVTTGR